MLRMKMSDTQEWDEASSIEVEKSVVGDPVKVSAGNMGRYLRNRSDKQW